MEGLFQPDIYHQVSTAEEILKKCNVLLHFLFSYLKVLKNKEKLNFVCEKEFFLK